MQYRRLGDSGLKVSAISVGSWLTLGGTVDADASRRVILAGWELGINFFDTADVYSKGEAERVLGLALADIPRREVVVATKVMGRTWEGPLGAGLSRKHVMDSVEESLRRLKVDYIDLYQAHAPDDGTPLEETLSTFNDLVRQGKVRYLGVSNFDTAQTREALRICRDRGWESIVSHQPAYNLMERRIEPALVPLAREAGVGFIVYSPLAQGVLTGKYGEGRAPSGSRGASDLAKFMGKWLRPEELAKVRVLEAVASRRGETPAQVALAWVLRDPVVSSAIIGATNPDQVRENAAAADVRLTAADIEELERAFPLSEAPL